VRKGEGWFSGLEGEFFGRDGKSADPHSAIGFLTPEQEIRVKLGFGEIELPAGHRHRNSFFLYSPKWAPSRVWASEGPFDRGITRRIEWLGLREGGARFAEAQKPRRRRMVRGRGAGRTIVMRS